MASPLALSLVASRSPTNVARPGDTLTFAFASPPKTATRVKIEVLHAVTSRVVATFGGRITEGKYVPETAVVGNKPAQVHTKISICDGNSSLVVDLEDGRNFAFTIELLVSVTGRIAGKDESFAGRAAVSVEYPLVMIAPTQTAKSDPALNSLAAWSQQWVKAAAQARTVVTITPIVPPKAVKSTDYDQLVQAFASAVSAAPGGIIALTTGHGDGGQGSPNSVAWCSLVSEDKAPTVLPDGGEVFRDHILFIDQAMLQDAVPPAFPGGSTLIRLNALDRIAAALKGAKIPIRKILLHTCNVGRNALFTGLLADRLRVPIQGHTDFMVYVGDPTKKAAILAHYQTRSPAADAATVWPTSLVSTESIPGATPAKVFPLAP
jgi:hypothetical protein